VNLLTVHDGFTLRDLVSYDVKHNEANGEGNRDGTDDNRSWNCGAEGPTDDPEVNALRARQSRAMLATLLLSFGVPLLLAGDEMGRTQQGNNNAYCQDNATTWVDWEHVDEDLLAFSRRLVALRRDHPTFRRRRFLSGADMSALAWFTPSGDPMGAANWSDPNARSLAVHLDGDDVPDRAEDGSPLVDDDFLMFVNGWWGPLDFVVPPTLADGTWVVELESAADPDPDAAAAGRAGPVRTVTVGPQSVTVLRNSHPTTDQHGGAT
jgi:glycogen operon protein